MARFVFFILTLIQACCAFAQETNVYVTVAGSLRSMVAELDLQQTTIIHVSGKINGDDVMVLKSLAGGDTGVENPIEGQLTSLDLSDADIVEGGSAYYISPDPLSSNYPNRCFTQNDTIGVYMFLDCKQLTDLTLPKSVKVIREAAFAGCSKLTTLNIPEGVTYIGAGIARDCSSLKTMVIPTTTQQVHCWAFKGVNQTYSIGCLAPVPPQCVDYTLDGSPDDPSSYSFFNAEFDESVKNLTLLVPQESYDLYANDPLWGSFGHMQPFTLSSQLDMPLDAAPPQDVYYRIDGTRASPAGLHGIFVKKGKKTIKMTR